MSTILDALRKSEQDRKLNKLPTLVDMAAPHEASRWPIYIGLILVLLAVVLVFVAYSLWNASTVFNPSVDVHRVVSQDSIPPFEASSQRNIQSEDAAEASLLEDDAETSIKVNVVSHSDDVTRRFAMVNGKLVREGDFVEPGLRVERIQLNAVEFNLRGESIILGPQ